MRSSKVAGRYFLARAKDKQTPRTTLVPNVLGIFLLGLKTQILLKRLVPNVLVGNAYIKFDTEVKLIITYEI